MLNKKDLNIEKTLITAKLSKLNQYLKFLKELQKSTMEAFASDFKVSGAAERYARTPNEDPKKEKFKEKASKVRLAIELISTTIGLLAANLALFQWVERAGSITC